MLLVTEVWNHQSESTMYDDWERSFKAVEKQGTNLLNTYDQAKAKDKALETIERNRRTRSPQGQRKRKQVKK
jgi:hypothetical protein